jgi:hypothetical protein
VRRWNEQEARDLKASLGIGRPPREKSLARTWTWGIAASLLLSFVCRPSCPSTSSLSLPVNNCCPTASPDSQLTPSLSRSLLDVVAANNAGLLLFNKWESADVEVKDISLTDYVQVRNAISLPHTAGRYAAKQFRKAQMPIVERLVNR